MTATPAGAAGPCDSVYRVHGGNACGRHDYCPQGNAQVCYAFIDYRSNIDGRLCKSELEFLGRCGA
jgi:hypothetical protein